MKNFKIIKTISRKPFDFILGSSQTKRRDLANIILNVMKKNQLSVHRPSKKNYDLNLFSHYLAGLIDGNGHISATGQVIINFSIKDIKSAYVVRSRIKYGRVKKVKNTNVCNLIISNKEGILYIASLIKDKLKHPDKIFQYNSHLTKLFNIEKTVGNSQIDWNTPWFSGFFDAVGHLRIYIIPRVQRLNLEIRLLAQIDQKESILLTQIQRQFGGYLNLRKNQNTFYYSSTSYQNIYKILTFFDRHSLQADRSYLKYVFLRKAYLLIQENKHLQQMGLKKIQKYQQKLIDMI